MEKISSRLVNLFIPVVFFSGFIDIKNKNNLNLSTILIIFLIFTMIILSFIYIIKNGSIIHVDLFLIIYMIFSALFFCLMPLSQESFFNKMLDFRDRIFYMFICIFIFEFIKQDKDLEKIIKITLKLSIFFAIFGIFQYIFRNKLPLWLLANNYSNINSYAGTDIVRTTGLLGNTIIYGNIMLMFFAIWFNKLLQYPKLKNLIINIIFIISIFTTFSRSAILGAAFIIIGMLLFKYFRSFYMGFNIKKLFVTIIGIGVIIISLTFFYYSPSLQANLKNSFVYNGLFMGNNVSVQGSTSGHIQFLHDGIEIMKNNILFGTGIATQRVNSYYSNVNTYITDSGILSFLCEIGVFAFIIYAILIIVVLKVTYKVIKIKKYSYLALGFLIFSLFEFLFASIINSAYWGKTFYLLYWSLAGCILSIYKINKKQNYNVQ